jgi:hypothetical protein
MTRKIHGLSLVAMLTLGGCCCLTSGTWEDDSGNWERAFKSTKPDDVKIVHSKHWRSPHWTYEFAYFFEIEANAKLKEQMFTQNKLRQLAGSDAANAKEDTWDPPAWFAPKAVDAYDVWIYEEEPRGNFRVLIDKETGTIFLTDHQV